ncbi:MAG: hypothetical protein DI536_16995 [Archangium gephyra]|uniref:Uncharacterized protein n=1 Tax=Archangium gephyra TaxID=48 RepID=A0A2W5US92_9BACT|nr:MAG: hypothetical protein DI536_16995 [Archangium gephyra]
MRTLTNTLLTAGLATAATTITAVVLGARRKRPAKIVNSTSHILWGDRDAKRASEFDLKHTLTGFALNAGAMVAWAGTQQLLFGKPAGRSLTRAAAVGAATSALAWLTDYKVVPKRLTPGFEMHLDAREMTVMYGVLAGALALGRALRTDEA